jgi:hypothetical protein
MRRFSRHILMVTFIALYGGMSTLGTAMHALPGFGHARAPRAETKARSDGRVATFVSGHDDCPVCHFLTQGQILDDPDHCGHVDVVQVRPADEIPLTAPAEVRRLTHPRAPPIA